MKKQIILDFPIEELAEQVALRSSEIIIKKIGDSFRLKSDETLQIKEITRKETAQYLEVTPPTVDTYTKEGLLKKYGFGKRGKYLLHEVEAAKPAIMASLHKWRIQSNKFISK